VSARDPPPTLTRLWTLASAAPNRLAVRVWHYHDDDTLGPDAAVELAMAGLPAAVRQGEVAHYRIDEHHSNAYAA